MSRHPIRCVLAGIVALNPILTLRAAVSETYIAVWSVWGSMNGMGTTRGSPRTRISIEEQLAGDDINAANKRKDVIVACSVLGIDPDYMLWFIKE